LSPAAPATILSSSSTLRKTKTGRSDDWSKWPRRPALGGWSMAEWRGGVAR
jgi:hypothetical protein